MNKKRTPYQPVLKGEGWTFSPGRQYRLGNRGNSPFLSCTNVCMPRAYLYFGNMFIYSSKVRVIWYCNMESKVDTRI